MSEQHDESLGGFILHHVTNDLNYTFLKFSFFGMDLKNHFVILGIKVVFISAIVTLFCLSTEKNTHALLILTGLFNLIVFHFIEAFATQKKLINNRNLIV